MIISLPASTLIMILIYLFFPLLFFFLSFFCILQFLSFSPSGDPTLFFQGSLWITSVILWLVHCVIENKSWSWLSSISIVDAHRDKFGVTSCHRGLRCVLHKLPLQEFFGICDGPELPVEGIGGRMASLHSLLCKHAQGSE